MVFRSHLSMVMTDDPSGDASLSTWKASEMAVLFLGGDGEPRGLSVVQMEGLRQDWWS